MSLITSLVAYWKLDGNSTDSVGSFNGTDTSITYSTGNGKINQGAGLNGSSSKITLGTGSISIAPSSGDFTISAWIKLAAIGANQAIYGRPDQNQFIVTSGNKIQLLVESSPGRATSTAVGGTSLTTGTWYHVVGIVTAGAKMEVFLNGVSDGSNSSSIPSNYFDQPGANVAIGALDNTPFVLFLNGDIDEVAFWGRALSPTEVTALYNGGAGTQYPFGTAWTKVLTENVSNTDTVIRTTTRSLIEAITNSDTFKHLWTLARSFTEAITNADTLVRTTARSLIEAITHSDLLAKIHYILLPGSFNSLALEGGLRIASTVTKVAAIFTPGSTVTLDSCNWDLDKTGTPTGTIVASVYAITGTPGSSAKPTGSPLATSDSISVSAIAGAGAWTRFSFSGANRISLVGGTTYAVSMEPSSTSDISNCVDADFSGSPPTNAENIQFNGTTWAVVSTTTCFQFEIFGVVTGGIFTQTLTEAITNADTFLRSITAVLAEAVTNTDNAIRSILRSLTASITNTAAAFKLPTRSLTETVSNADTFAFLRTKGASLTEALSVTATFVRSLVRTITETLSESDTVTGARVLPASFTEAIALLDVLSRITTKALSELLAQTDTTIRSTIRALSESITNAASFAGARTHLEALAEALSQLDTIAHATTRTFVEAISNADIIIHAATFMRSLTESVTNTAAALKASGRAIMEAVSLTDTFARLASFTRTFAETFIVADTVRILLNGSVVIWHNLRSKVSTAWTDLTKQVTSYTQRAKTSTPWTDKPKSS